MFSSDSMWIDIVKRSQCWCRERTKYN